MPPPRGDPAAPLQALVIDSWFDNYVGVVMLVRVVNGEKRASDRIRLMANDSVHNVRPGRRLHARQWRASRSRPDEVGFVITGIKELEGSQGRRHHHPCRPGRPSATAFAGIQGDQAVGLRRPLSDRGQASTTRCAMRSRSCELNDASLHFEPEVSQALGFGFRCGFLGMLHMDIVQERLEREYGMELITTAPTVIYEVVLPRRHDRADREPGADARPGAHRGDPRADRQGRRVRPAGLRRPGDHALQRQARRPARPRLPRSSCASDLRDCR